MEHLRQRLRLTFCQLALRNLNEIVPETRLQSVNLAFGILNGLLRDVRPSKTGVQRDRSDRRRTPGHLPERPPRRHQSQRRTGQQARLKRRHLQAGSITQQSRAKPSQERNEERKDDDIRYVEERMRHRHMPTGILAQERIPLGAGIDQMKERRSPNAPFCEDEHEGHHQQQGAEDVEQRMRERRTTGVHVRPDRGQQRGDGRPDIVAQDDRNRRPEVDDPGVREGDG